jgi:hypothetical protein
VLRLRGARDVSEMGVGERFGRGARCRRGWGRGALRLLRLELLTKGSRLGRWREYRNLDQGSCHRSIPRRVGYLVNLGDLAFRRSPSCLPEPLQLSGMA